MVLLSVFFGIVALMVASIGLYGIMSYLVARRTNEISIRLALGATKSQVQGLVLRQAAGMVLPGLAAGVMLALAAGGWVQSLVYGIDGRDPVSVGIATLVLAATTLVAALLPARRAASVELARALRGD
jgi:ABC-type antimicrobial peptide transport system permease subunit